MDAMTVKTAPKITSFLKYPADLIEKAPLDALLGGTLDALSWGANLGSGT